MPLEMEAARTGWKPGEPRNAISLGGKQKTTTITAPASTRKPKRKRRSATGRREASWMKADVCRVLRARRETGPEPDHEARLAAGHALASVMNSASPGPYRLSGPHGKTVNWRPLTPELLESELKRLGYELWPDVCDQIVADIEENERQYGQRWRPSGDDIAALLNISAAERDAADARTLGAIDQSPDQRAEVAAERERQQDRERKRLARKCKPRAEYLAESKSVAKPWEAFGVSRRTWERWVQKGDTRVAGMSGKMARVASMSGHPSAVIEDNLADREVAAFPMLDERNQAGGAPGGARNSPRGHNPGGRTHFRATG